jgi:hypothetical protein
VNYVQVAWSLLLVGWLMSQYVRSTARMSGLIAISANLAGLVVCTWNAVRGPGDWVNGFAAAWLLFLLMAWWLVRRWVSHRQA